MILREPEAILRTEVRILFLNFYGNSVAANGVSAAPRRRCSAEAEAGSRSPRPDPYFVNRKPVWIKCVWKASYMKNCSLKPYHCHWVFQATCFPIGTLSRPKGW